jgi:hypothetical protein
VAPSRWWVCLLRASYAQMGRHVMERARGRLHRGLCAPAPSAAPPACALPHPPIPSLPPAPPAQVSCASDGCSTLAHPDCVGAAPGSREWICQECFADLEERAADKAGGRGSRGADKGRRR